MLLHAFPLQEYRLRASLAAYQADRLSLHSLSLRIDTGAGPISQAVAHNLGQVARKLVVARESVRRDPHHRPIVSDSNQKIPTFGI